MRIHSPVKFQAQSEKIHPFWLGSFIVLALSTLVLRLFNLGSPLIEPHPWRQAQTALTTYGLFHNQVNFWFYESPLNGKLWDFVFEFPVYQALSAGLMRLGLGLEISSRLISIFCFFSGAGFVFLIVKKLFSQKVAFWTLFFYLASPFNLIYSRTALIDNCVQTLVLSSIFFLILWLGNSHFIYWLVFVLLGSLAAASKITIWIAPWTVLGCFLLAGFRREKHLSRETLLMALGLGIQLFSYWIWSCWTDSHRDTSGFEMTRQWIIGDWSSRLEIWRWIKISKWALRNVLADWMAVPFFLGLLALGRKSGHLISALFLIVCPIFLFFNVYTYHDYYLIAQAPYLATIAGLGATYLGELRSLPKRLALVSLGILVLNHLRIVPFYLEPMFKKDPSALSLEHDLKEISHPNELLFVRIKENPWQIPLYSERLVATQFSEKWLEAGELKPSLFYFPPSQEAYHLLDSFSDLAVISHNRRFFFRVKEIPEFSWDRSQMIMLSNSVFPKAQLISLPDNLPLDLNHCNSNNSQRPVLYELPQSLQGSSSRFLLSFNGQKLLLPGRRFLSLPLFEESCHFSLLSEKGTHS